MNSSRGRLPNSGQQRRIFVPVRRCILTSILILALAYQEKVGGLYLETGQDVGVA